MQYDDTAQGTALIAQAEDNAKVTSRVEKHVVMLI